MSQWDIREIRAVLGIVRESNALLFGLKVSMRSVSSGYDLIEHGLQDYLKTTEKDLQVRLVVSWMNLVCSALYKATFTVIHGCWSRITRKSQWID
jgi:hypothetical protein